MPHGEGTYGKQVGRPAKKGRAVNARAKRQVKKQQKAYSAKRKRGY